MDLISDLTLVVVAALIGGFLAQHARQPLIVGYLIAGVVVGPFTGGLTVSNPHDIEQLAELGVALLLFSLGLEVSFRELGPVRRVAIAGGLMQVLLTAALGFIFAATLGWERQPALWFGASISLSSTMVALKTLQAQGRLGTLSSRVMLGILVVQDLAVVPMMILLPELGAPGSSMLGVATATIRSIALLGVIVLVATRIVPWLLPAVARRNSRELFVLMTTAVALGIGVAAWQAGLSLALGAFIAGLVINESEYAHQALSEVIPLRDLFGMLFFVSAGMLLDPTVVWQQRGVIAGSVAAVTIAKAAVLAAIVAAFGYRRIVPLATALTLFQVGEFAFVLVRAGRSAGALTDGEYTVILNTAIVTMAITPAVSAIAPYLYARLRRRADAEPLLTVNVPEVLAGHIVIAGAGRVGRTVGDALTRLKLPFVMVEYDARRFERAREAGLPAIYGDAGQPTVLDAAGVARARAVLVTVPAFPDVRNIVRVTRSLNADAVIVARADSVEATEALHALGIREVTSPEFEGAMDMTRRALVCLNVPAEKISTLNLTRSEPFRP